MEAAHPGELTNLLLGAARARVGHHVDGVELAALGAGFHLLEQLFRDLLG